MIELPPPRDLPPHRQARIRAEIVRAVDGPPRRRWIAPLATGLAAAAAVAVWLVPREGTAPIDPAASPGVATTAAPTVTGPSSGFPGVSSRMVEEMERGCALITNYESSTPPTPESSDTAETIRLRNLLDDEAGRLVLIVGAGRMVQCSVEPNGHYTGGFTVFGQQVDPDPGPVTLDLATSSPGERVLGLRGSQVVAGRIFDDRVVRVTVTCDGRTADATVANGTYLVRFLHGTDWKSPAKADVRVTAYDANGAEVGAVIT
ncbi:hypothetical protein [Actinokineospora sp. NPDC004072]